MAAQLKAVTTLAAREWLESTSLARIALVVGRRLGVPVGDLDDLIQELRISIWRKGPDTPLNSSWVFRAAAFRALDLRRARARYASRLTDRTPSEPNQELTALLHAGAARLPRRCRDVYRLRLAGESEREVAAHLRTSRAMVRRIDAWCLRFFAGRVEP